MSTHSGAVIHMDGAGVEVKQQTHDGRPSPVSSCHQRSGPLLVTVGQRVSLGHEGDLRGVTPVECELYTQLQREQ